MRTAHQELRRNYQNLPKPTPSFIDADSDSQSVVVNAPVSEVYHRCLRLEDFPRFIASIKKIDRIDDIRFSCTSMIKGKEQKTVVTIMMRVPDRRIAWQGVFDNFRVGVVSFDPLPGGATKVTVKMRSVLEPVMLNGLLRHYLRKFKLYIENNTGGNDTSF
jgi:uncharacterized membrane protein